MQDPSLLSNIMQVVVCLLLLNIQKELKEKALVEKHNSGIAKGLKPSKKRKKGKGKKSMAKKVQKNEFLYVFQSKSLEDLVPTVAAALFGPKSGSKGSSESLHSEDSELEA